MICPCIILNKLLDFINDWEVKEDVLSLPNAEHLLTHLALTMVELSERATVGWIRCVFCTVIHQTKQNIFLFGGLRRKKRT